MQMVRTWLIVLLNLVVSALLALITLNTLDLVRGKDHIGLNEWYILGSLFGSPTGVVSVILLLVIFIVDSIWLLFFITWTIKKILRIKDNKNTLYIP